MIKTILTIGAYERDNFGDVLFFLVLEHYAKKQGFELVAGSYIGADMRPYFGQYILPYDFLLSEYSFHTVWVAGGEMGACTIEYAMAMSIERQYTESYKKLSSETKNIIHDTLSATLSDHLAYLPWLEKYEKNKYTPLVVNSVGGFETLEQYGQELLLRNTMDVLRKAYSVSVRNKQSHEYLLTQGVQNQLVPDSVHAIALFYNPTRPIEKEYILFQMSEDLINTYGVENVAQHVYEIIKKYNYPVYLFSAGTASYHDSIEYYYTIRKYIHDTYDENRVEVVEEKSALVRVDWIAFAKMFIGSSLHGRIVAIAFGVPRISFSLEKVNNYVALWDTLFPFNVNLDNLLIAVETAFVTGKSSNEEKGNHYAHIVSEHMGKILHQLYER